MISCVVYAAPSGKSDDRAASVRPIRVHQPLCIEDLRREPSHATHLAPRPRPASFKPLEGPMVEDAHCER